MTDTFNRVQAIFRDVLDDPKLTLARNSHAGTVPGWDSLAHISLVYNIEQEFGVRFSLDELQSFRNIGDLLHLLGQKTAAK